MIDILLTDSGHGDDGPPEGGGNGSERSVLLVLLHEVEKS